jgi:hypothetical protein
MIYVTDDPAANVDIRSFTLVKGEKEFKDIKLPTVLFLLSVQSRG